MKPSELKELCQKFARTLDNDDKDEWYNTERGVWNEFSKNFVQWYNNYGKKQLEKNASGA